MKILLLNPPSQGTVLHRDGYCSAATKSSYIWHPMDLLFQSGYFSTNHDLKVIDAIAEKLSAQTVLSRVIDFQPDVILSLIGSIAGSKDIRFLESLAPKWSGRVFISGDLARFRPAETLTRTPFVEGILTDFTSPALRDYLETGAISDQLLLRSSTEQLPSKVTGEFTYPLPAWDKFDLKRYSLPFYRGHFASVLFSFGCPFNCSFCNTHKLGYKVRNIVQVIEELEWLKKKDIRNIYVRDATLNGNLNHLKHLLRTMITRNLKFHWNAFVTPLPCDRELVELMKQTGCFLVQMGIETGSDDLRKKLGKNIPAAKIKEVIEMYRAQGIKISGHFIVGLPDDTEATLGATKKFIEQLDLDFLSLNVASNRPGTAFKGTPQNIGLDLGLEQIQDDLSPWSVPKYVETWRRKTLLTFYLSPRTLRRNIKAIRSWDDLVLLLKNGFSFFRNL